MSNYLNISNLCLFFIVYYEFFGLNNLEVVSLTVTSNASGCSFGAQTTVSTANIEIEAWKTPAVTIGVSTGYSNNVCPGGQVNFEVTATTEAGGSPTYQWKLNGGNVGSNSNSIALTNLADNDMVTCVMTTSSTYSCLTTTTDLSNAISINHLTPPEDFALLGAGSVCASGQGTTTRLLTING